MPFRINLNTFEKARGEVTKEFTDLEMRKFSGESAIESIQAIMGLFALISLIDFGKYFINKEDSPFGTDEITYQFEAIGQLGMALSDNCLSNLEETLKGYRELMEKLK